MIPQPPRSTRTDTLFPFTTHFRSTMAIRFRFSLQALFVCGLLVGGVLSSEAVHAETTANYGQDQTHWVDPWQAQGEAAVAEAPLMPRSTVPVLSEQDRKSTRLNSSH